MWGGGFGGVFLWDKQRSQDPAEWKLENRVLGVNVDKSFNYYLDLCLPEKTVSTLNNCHHYLV